MNKLPCALLITALLLSACSGQVTDPTRQLDSHGDNSAASDEITDSYSPVESEAFDGFALTADGVRLLPGVTVGVDTLLGTPDDTLEAPSCIHEGYDIVYYYSGLEIVTAPSAAGNVVTSITVTSDEIETEEGVTIGSSFESVVAAYGDYDATLSAPDFGRYVFRRGSTTISMLLTDDAVTSISYAVEE